MTPETKARLKIDDKLEQAGWVVQDLKDLNPGAAKGVAVREYPTDTGPADYVLLVDRQSVGVIRAKRDDAGENLTVTESQTAPSAPPVPLQHPLAPAANSRRPRERNSDPS